MAIFLEIIKGPRQVSWGKMEVEFFIEKKEGEYCRVLSYKNTPANRVCDIGSASVVYWLCDTTNSNKL